MEIVVELIGGQHLELFPGLDHHGGSLSPDEVDPPVRTDGRGIDVAEVGDPLGQMKISSKAKSQGVTKDATALLTACGLALRSFD